MIYNLPNYIKGSLFVLAVGIASQATARKDGPWITDYLGVHSGAGNVLQALRMGAWNIEDGCIEKYLSAMDHQSRIAVGQQIESVKITLRFLTSKDESKIQDSKMSFEFLYSPNLTSVNSQINTPQELSCKIRSFNADISLAKVKDLGGENVTIQKSWK